MKRHVLTVPVLLLWAALTAMPSRMNSTIRASSTLVNEVGMPVLTCMVTEPADSRAMKLSIIHNRS